MPVAEAGGIQPGVSCTGWLGTTLVSKYRVERWKRGRTVHGLGRGRSEEVEGEEEQADVNNFLAT